jgi:response regulator of citrate/malate metabolism
MIRTLIVEDDPVVAEVNRGYLERMSGFAVVGTAETGQAALATVSEAAVDLVLLDFHLPDIDGLDVCRALRAGRRDPVDIIAVTAARDVETVHSALSHGVVQYLIKPYSFATFQDKLIRYAEYHQNFSGSGPTNQEEVDRRRWALCGTSTATVPKGLSDTTYQKIVEVLRDTDKLWSAIDVADTTGLSRVTVRRYLDYLHHQDLLDLSPRYGGPGRPEHHYRWRKRS